MKITQKFLRNELAALKEKHELAKNQVAITYGAMQAVEQMLLYCKKKGLEGPTPEQMEAMGLAGATEIGEAPDASGPQDSEDGLSDPGS